MVLIYSFEIIINLFYLGFALFFLVAFVVFVVAWEKILRRSIERLINHISTSNANNSRWIRITKLLKRFSW